MREKMMPAVDTPPPSKEQRISELNKSLEEGLLRGKELRKAKRTLAVLSAEKAREESNHVGRKIPEDIAFSVRERDYGRNFGRPGHQCENPGAPHHITHYKDLKEGGNPHTVDNLEAPCDDCHALAHALGVPSGTSIADLFRSIDSEDWIKIESAWSSKSPIRNLGHTSQEH